SSRRRHTRSKRDWSSDVCSSDLALPGMVDAGNVCRIAAAYLRDELRHLRLVSFETDELLDYRGARPQATFDGTSFAEVEVPELRSEERRVGKECGSRGRRGREHG